MTPENEVRVLELLETTARNSRKTLVMLTIIITVWLFVVCVTVFSALFNIITNNTRHY